MLPKHHIIFGFLFALLITPILTTNFFLVFFASFLIDFDHYIWYIIKKKDWSLKNAYYYLKGLRHEKPTMMVFHTIEFHLIVGLLIFVWIGFFYVFIGMVFHSLSDIATINNSSRGFSFIKFLFSDKNNYE